MIRESTISKIERLEPASYKRGFTLFEILIAIFILGIVISTIYGAYSGTFSIVDTTTSEAEIYAMARTAMERIVEDLEAVYFPAETPPPPGEGAEETEDSYGLVTIAGEVDHETFDNLIFTSTAHLSFTKKTAGETVATIAYYLAKKDDSEIFALRRSDELIKPGSSLEDGMSSGPILCEALSRIEFVYHDAKGESYDRWDSTSDEFEHRVPAMVTLNLQFANPSDPDAPYIFTTAVAIPAGLRRQE